VVTVLFALAGWTANCYHGVVSHSQFIAFLTVRRPQSRNLASDLSISLLFLDSPGKCQDFRIVNPIWRRWRPASFAPLLCNVLLPFARYGRRWCRAPVMHSTILGSPSGHCLT
jgi:hypothetical protein